MSPRDFAYWLQGFAGINGEPPTAAQWQVIKDHLALVFDKQTPERIPVPPRPPVFKEPEKYEWPKPSFDGPIW